jgi:malonate transporter and related proteins
MTGVLIGFAIIGAIVVAGYLVGRSGMLGSAAPAVLARLAFFVLSPCLLFTVVAEADVRALFSSLLLASAIAAAVPILLFAAVALLLWRRRLPEAVIGSLSSGVVNANNIGLPVAVYVLGDPAYPAPIILLQVLVLTPIGLTLLDVSTSGSVSLRRILLRPFVNPLLIGSALGVAVAVTGVQVPEAVMEPFEIVGAAAVPVMLLAFGMSLHGQRPLAPGSGRRDILLASTLKLAVMPAVAGVAGYLLGLRGQELYAVTVLAALPTAQNVFNHAQRYERGLAIARDTVLITTLVSLPILLLIAFVLRP